MDSPSFREFKRQASFFFKEKIKAARLVLTDVTPAELLTEEAIDGDSWSLDARTIGFISRAAFEVDDYWRIVDILHKRIWKYDKTNWESSYKALIVLERLLTNGPKRVAEDFECDKDIIWEMGSLKYVDEKGFNWGSSVRKKSERILKLLEDGSFLKEERDRARKITNGMKGFGSFCQHSSSTVAGNSKGSTFRTTYVRCNSHYNTPQNQEDDDFDSIKGYATKERIENAQETCEEDHKLIQRRPEGNSNSRLSIQGGYTREEDHPFCNDEHHQLRSSLISSRV